MLPMSLVMPKQQVILLDGTYGYGATPGTEKVVGLDANGATTISSDGSLQGFTNLDP